MRQLSDVDGLTAADVMHRNVSSLPAGTTVGEVRKYFAASASRQLALVVDAGRYVGSIMASAIPDEAGETVAAADYTSGEPTIHPRAPARTARDVALEHRSQRLPVVDDTGTLVGIVAIDGQRKGFCGT